MNLEVITTDKDGKQHAREVKDKEPLGLYGDETRIEIYIASDSGREDELKREDTPPKEEE